MSPLHPLASSLAALALSLAPGANAISLGQVDDFQEQTLEGWSSGGGPPGNPNPNPPLVAPICGPSEDCGPDIDYYGRIISSGAPPPAAGRALAISNTAQWAGDYLAAGVDSIELDVNNLGTTDIHLRLAIVSTDVNGGTFFLSDSILISPHGTGALGWANISFDISPDSWRAMNVATQLGPPGVDIDTALSSVSLLRILSNPNNGVQGDSIAAILGVDNITAVPEPGTFSLVMGGLAFLGWRRSS